MDENETWDWEELKNLLGRLRLCKYNPEVNKHISTLIMEGRSEKVPAGKPNNYRDLLGKAVTRAITKTETDEAILFSQTVRFFQELEAVLTVIFTIMQTENAKQTIAKLSPNIMAYMQKKFRKLSKEHIYPYKFRDDAVPYESLSNMFRFWHYETTVRIFIDALLKPIKQQNDLTVLVEEPLGRETKCDDTKQKSSEKKLKPDYLIFYDHKPLGVIEAKNARYLIRSSITQCMTQLLALHRKEKEVRKRTGPLFGIVTDALHFIFIKLTPDKQFVLERENYGKTPPGLGPMTDEIKVHTANTWEDLYAITAIINGLCQQMIRENSIILLDVSPGIEAAADVGIPQIYKQKCR